MNFICWVGCIPLFFSRRVQHQKMRQFFPYKMLLSKVINSHSFQSNFYQMCQTCSVPLYSPRRAVSVTPLLNFDWSTQTDKNSSLFVHFLNKMNFICWVGCIPLLFSRRVQHENIHPIFPNNMLFSELKISHSFQSNFDQTCQTCSEPLYTPRRAVSVTPLLNCDWLATTDQNSTLFVNVLKYSLFLF